MNQVMLFVTAVENTKHDVHRRLGPISAGRACESLERLRLGRSANGGMLGTRGLVPPRFWVGDQDYRP